MLFRKKKTAEAGGNEKIPPHIAIIMDGNGRWAQARKMPRTYGHSVGSENFRRIAEYCAKLGVKYLTVYAFSTENWDRPLEEIDVIMSLLEKNLMEAVGEMTKKNIRLRFFGDTSPLSHTLLELIRKTDALSRDNTGLCVNVCLNYGGRAELVKAMQELGTLCRTGQMQPGDITEARIAEHLYSAGIPDPDLLIRPGGEQRLSNFLLWQLAYTEMYFTDKMWPDIDAAELDRAIAAYGKRQRRFGGLPGKR